MLITQGLVELNRGALRLAHIQIDQPHPGRAGRRFGGFDDRPRQAMAAGPRGDKMGADLGDVGLGLVVAGGTDQLRGAGDGAVEAPDEELPVGDQHDPSPIGLHHVPRRRLQPAETAAGLDALFGRFAEILQIVVPKGGQPLDQGGGHEALGRKWMIRPCNRYARGLLLILRAIGICRLPWAGAAGVAALAAAAYLEGACPHAKIPNGTAPPSCRSVRMAPWWWPATARSASAT